jgi:hypothetical protein
VKEFRRAEKAHRETPCGCCGGRAEKCPTKSLFETPPAYQGSRPPTNSTLKRARQTHNMRDIHSVTFRSSRWVWQGVLSSAVGFGHDKTPAVYPRYQCSNPLQSGPHVHAAAKWLRIFTMRTFRAGVFPRSRVRGQERSDLLREQELLAGLGIQLRQKKPNDIEPLFSDSDRPKGPWQFLLRGTCKIPSTVKLPYSLLLPTLDALTMFLLAP